MGLCFHLIDYLPRHRNYAFDALLLEDLEVVPLGAYWEESLESNEGRAVDYPDPDGEECVVVQLAFSSS